MSGAIFRETESLPAVRRPSLAQRLDIDATDVALVVCVLMVAVGLGWLLQPAVFLIFIGGVGMAAILRPTVAA